MGDYEEEVAAAASWIAKARLEDGRWKWDYSAAPARRRATAEGTGTAKSDIAATGLAILALMASGSNHRSGKHSRPIRNGLSFIVANQMREGGFCASGDQHFMYGHALATITLAESMRAAKDRSLRAPLERAVAFIAKAQLANPLGGWRYNPRDPEADTSMFAWQVMALRAADRAGVPLAAANVAAGRRYLASVRLRGKDLYSYEPGVPVATASCTAAGVSSRQLLGEVLDDNAFAATFKQLTETVRNPRSRSAYVVFFGTMAAFRQGKARYEQWKEAALEPLAARQDCDPKSTECGCWGIAWFGDPPAADATSGGRLYVTALAALALAASSDKLSIFLALPGN